MKIKYITFVALIISVSQIYSLTLNSSLKVETERLLSADWVIKAEVNSGKSLVDENGNYQKLYVIKNITPLLVSANSKLLSFDKPYKFISKYNLKVGSEYILFVNHEYSVINSQMVLYDLKFSNFATEIIDINNDDLLISNPAILKLPLKVKETKYEFCKNMNKNCIHKYSSFFIQQDELLKYLNSLGFKKIEAN